MIDAAESDHGALRRAAITYRDVLGDAGLAA
jgi:hypothetical protein